MSVPRTLHYCWFGGKPKPPIFAACLASWQRFAPDYRIVEWNEASFDIEAVAFVRDAYAQRRFAFVSDYVRAWALAQHGGIYLDTDCELRRPLDEFLQHRAFSGFEAPGLPFTALWGSEAHHPWPQAVLDYYATRRCTEAELPNTLFVSEILVKSFGIDPAVDALQLGHEGVAIYPSTHFCLDIAVNYAVHHFEGSWLGEGRKQSYKSVVMRRYHLNQLLDGEPRQDVADILSRLIRLHGYGVLLRGLLAVWREKLVKEWARFRRRRRGAL